METMLEKKVTAMEAQDAALTVSTVSTKRRSSYMRSSWSPTNSSKEVTGEGDSYLLGT